MRWDLLPGDFSRAFESAPIPATLLATLRFLRKMPLDPQALTPDDARSVLATGVSGGGNTNTPGSLHIEAPLITTSVERSPPS